MKKYYLIGKGVIDEIIIDRVNFFVWRLRIVISLLIAYFLWSALLFKQPTISGYNSSMMLTYVLFASLASSFIFSTRSYSVGDEINQGNLSNHLLRPYNYFLALFSSDIGDKLMNFFCAVFEITILYVILKPSIYWQTNGIILFYTLLAVCLATLLFFLFGLLLGAVGFWSAEVWGPRFIFGIAIAILSGQMFPMDMLPKPLFMVTQFLPFTYLIYFPVKVYLGQLPLSQIIFGLSVAAFWVGCLYYLVHFVWHKGLLQYSAQGR